MKQFLPWVSALILAVITSSCMVGPNYRSPEVAVPDFWYEGVRRDADPRSSQLETWWQAFRDPALNELIGKAREANPTLKAALAAVRQARAERGVAVSTLLPFLDGSGSYSRDRASESLMFPVPTNPSNLYSIGLDAGWEIDVFGGNRRLVEAADASLEAFIESYRDVLISLYAEVALNYINVRTLEDRIHIANENIRIQSDSLGIAQSRRESGLAPEIDVTQAQSNLYRTESTVPALESQLTAARNRISTLLGGYPGSVESILRQSRGIPAPRASFGYGLPADLLRSRPDVRQAERNLAAQTALIGVNVANLYPKFALFGNFGFRAVDSQNWLQSDSRTWGFGPSFQWAIFSGGQIRSQIKAQEAVTEQALFNYENTVLSAVEEVESAMVAIGKERQRFAKLQQAVDASEKTVSLIGDNYKAGLVDFQNVLDSERTLFEVQNEAVGSEGDASANYVILYKALGGGAPVEAVEIPVGDGIIKGKPAAVGDAGEEVKPRLFRN